MAFEHLQKEGVAEVQKRIDDTNVPFDYFCWDLYSKMATYYAEHPESQEWRRETLHRIERGEGETALMTCVRAGSLEAVESLLAHGANVVTVDRKVVRIGPLRPVGEHLDDGQRRLAYWRDWHYQIRGHRRVFEWLTDRRSGRIRS